jgi:tRNA (mo5U34)-methyltransferase
MLPSYGKQLAASTPHSGMASVSNEIKETQNEEFILKRAKELAPWHFDFALPRGQRTTDCNDPQHPDPNKRAPGTLDPNHIRGFFKTYYPDGLGGKEVLDVGCNAGGYCFIAAELGAKSCAGFDARQHWIDQARFVHENLYPHLANVSFQVSHVEEYLRQFGQTDIVIFKGVFYHLPDPIHVLLELCKITRDVIFVNTECDLTVPEHCLSYKPESTTRLMSGVDGPAWWPGGPAALRPILEYQGFEVNVPAWNRDEATGTGRFTIIGKRKQSSVGS